MDVKGLLGTTTNDLKGLVLKATSCIALVTVNPWWVVVRTTSIGPVPVHAVGTSSWLRNIHRPAGQHMPNAPTQKVLPMRLQQSPRQLHCQLQHKWVDRAPATKPNAAALPTALSLHDVAFTRAVISKRCRCCQPSHAYVGLH